MSTGPPAAKPIIQCTGRSGYAAEAGGDALKRPESKTSPKTLLRKIRNMTPPIVLLSLGRMLSQKRAAAYIAASRC
jgi:hypothetical protein